MRRTVFILLFLKFAVDLNAQHTPQYTQFIFNKAGYNPAAAGTSLKSPIEIIFGGRTQYIGLDNNPKTAFFSGNYTFIPQRAYKNWHNAGVYIDQDRNGAFFDNSIYLTYAFHQLITKKTVMSVGVFAGLKQFYINSSLFDRNDPAVAASARSLMIYPDIIPGIRIYNRKFFADLSFWQVVTYQQKGFFSSKQIGSPSKLPLHYNFSIGRKFILPLENKLLISFNMRSSYKNIPDLELNVMNYWYQRFAYGFSVRNKDFVCGIFQIRIVNNLIVGLAYDLSVNKMFKPNTHTAEIMIGLSPIFGTSGEKRMKSSVDDCSF
jgi:type IX secretion system PorP/SprF family membrane protein